MNEHNRDLDRLAGVLTLLLVFAMAARFAVSADTWWHLRAGEWIWQHKALPWVDHFSYTRAGAPWHYPGAPVEVLMYWLVRWGGLGALNLAVALVVTLTWGFVWLTIGTLDVAVHPLVKVVVVALGAAASAVYWSARPHLATFLLSALFLWVLARAKGHRGRLLWWLPVLMVLWVNSHGAFIMGIVWWGVYWVAAAGRWFWAQWHEGKNHAPEAWRWLLSLTLVGVALMFAVLVNPYGLEMFFYPFKTLGMRALQDIAEWQAPNFRETALLPTLVMLLGLGWAVGLSAKRMTVEGALLVGGVFVLAMTAARNVALFALVAAPVLARHGEFLRREVMAVLPRKDAVPAPVRPKINLALVGLIAFAAFLKAGVNALPGFTAAQIEKNYPMGAVRFLKAHPPQEHLFNYYDWGGFLMWNLREYPVFIDGRTDLYGDDFIQQWLNVMQARPEWKAVLDYWHVDRVLIPPDTRLGAALQANDWRLLYHDDLCELYGR